MNDVKAWIQVPPTYIDRANQTAKAIAPLLPAHGRSLGEVEANVFAGIVGEQMEAVWRGAAIKAAWNKKRDELDVSDQRSDGGSDIDGWNVKCVGEDQSLVPVGINDTEPEKGYIAWESRINGRKRYLRRLGTFQHNQCRLHPTASGDVFGVTKEEVEE